MFHLTEGRKLNRTSNRGAALMVAVIIIGILMVFTFSLLLVTYTLYSSQNKKAASKRNAEAANTLSIALTTELTSDDAAYNELWRYLRFNICQDRTWPYYDPECTEPGHDEEAAFRYFDLKLNYSPTYFNEASPEEDSELQQGELEGFPGTVRLCIYWMPTEKLLKKYDHNALTVDQIKEVVPAEGDDEEGYEGKKGLRLFIEVICQTASQSYVVKNEYSLQMDPVDKTHKRMLKAISGTDAFNPMQFDTEGDDADINVEEKWIWKLVSRE